MMFKYQTQKEWLDLVKKEFKNKPIENLYYQKQKDLGIQAFYTKDDAKVLKKPLGKFSQTEFVKHTENKNLTENPINLYLNFRGEFSWHGSALLSLEKLKSSDRLFLDVDFTSESEIYQLISSKDLAQQSIFIMRSPFDYWLKEGNFLENAQQDIQQYLEFHISLQKKFDTLNSLVIDLGKYANLGLDVPEQMAFGLLELEQLVNETNDKDLEYLLKGLFIKFNFNSQFLQNLALYQSFHIVLAEYFKQKEINHDFNFTTIVGSVDFDKAPYDNNLNLLRNTTENLCASLSGAGFFIPNYQLANNEFYERMCFNTRQLIAHESMLKTIENNPIEGSYFLNEMISIFSQSAWKIFTQLSQDGTYSDLLEKNTIQDIILKKQDGLLNEFDQRKKIVLGVNHYFHQIDYEYIERKTDNNSSAFKPIKPFLYHKNIAEWRLKFSSLTNNKILLIPFGKSAIANTRLGFIDNFLKPSGLEIIESKLLKVEEVDDKLNGSDALLNILCADDDAYLEWALKQDAKTLQNVAIAGFPPNKEELINKGILLFMGLGSKISEIYQFIYQLERK